MEIEGLIKYVVGITQKPGFKVFLLRTALLMHAEFKTYLPNQYILILLVFLY